MTDDAPKSKITAKPGRVEIETANSKGEVFLESIFVDHVKCVSDSFSHPGEASHVIGVGDINEGGGTYLVKYKELLAAIDEAKRLERAEAPWESVGLDPLWRLERISLRAQLSLAEKKLQDRDDLETLIASVVTADSLRTAEFDVDRDGSFAAYINDYEIGERHRKYVIAESTGPTFAAALRAAIEKLGEGA